MTALVNMNSDWNFWRKRQSGDQKLKITGSKCKRKNGAENNSSDTYSSNYPLGTLLEEQRVETMCEICTSLNLS